MAQVTCMGSFIIMELLGRASKFANINEFKLLL